MEQPERGSGSRGDGSFELDRRKTLKLIGGSAAGVALFAGTASAHMSKFFGCSQVCSGTDGNLAVVATKDGYEVRSMDQTSNRGNVEWTGTSHCYEVKDGEAIVGMIETEATECFFCPNPNNCASNYYDDVSDILADLNSFPCGGQTGNISVNNDCDVTGTGRGKGNA